jgi:hypothetical protein
MKQLIVFDLDGTLAESKFAPDAEMAALPHDLLGIVKVAVISGGDWPQFESQLLATLPHDERLAQLSLLPTSGTKFFHYTDGWMQLYAVDLTASEKETIVNAFQRAIVGAHVRVKRVWGEVIEDWGSQITYSALGQQAPIKEKDKRDPDFSKRRKIVAILAPLLPAFSVRMGRDLHRCHQARH